MEKDVTVLMSRMKPVGTTLRVLVRGQVAAKDPPPLAPSLHRWVELNYPGWFFDGWIDADEQYHHPNGEE